MPILRQQKHDITAQKAAATVHWRRNGSRLL